MEQGLFREVWVEVWLPLAFNRPLTYRIYTAQTVEPGMRIVVPLKGKRLYTGFVWQIVDSGNVSYEVKAALEVVDETPFLDGNRLRFLEWMANYYACSLGEVLLAAIPAPYRLSSESFVQLHPDYKGEAEDESSEALWVFKALSKAKRLPLSDIGKAMGAGKNWLRLIRKLADEQKLLIFDELPDRFKPRAEWWLELAAELQSNEAIDRLFDQISQKADEEAFILKFLARTWYSDGSWKILKASFVMDDHEKKVLNRLVKRKILVSRKEATNPFSSIEVETLVNPELSPAQEHARLGIEYGFSINKVVLLMGVTGSGKTEIYINLVATVLKENKQCLLMLPEIAITVQIVSRLRQVFKDAMGVYHSRATMPERQEVWEGVATGKLQLVVGVRSAVFLPFQSLGLIIADEEHDSSYKQTEPAPRYHGRDAAIYLASVYGAKILLGSASPSVESYHKAKSGKWHLVRLEERFGGAIMPEILYVDVKKAQRTKAMKLDFSETILDFITQAKEAGQQSIVFQNRRGYAPCLQCNDCGWVPYCPQCDVSLTYHQAKRSLNCHYCGHHEDIPRQCNSCGSVALQTSGFGTEKLEESLEVLLPNLRIARMDQDTTQSRKSYDQLLGRMKSLDIDVLVGTQMVTKGLDFENVTFVAVMDIDRALHYPEFRANERTFQLLSQISGRAGRRKSKGVVAVQTAIPFHPLFTMLAKGETELFYDTEVAHRRNFDYPPFSRLIRITSRHSEEPLALKGIEMLAARLRQKLGSEMVLGPEAPSIARLRNKFIFNLILKISFSISHQKVKELVLAEVRFLQSEKDWRTIQWIIDVDPN